uniref:Uncharacterized protein n=1 Tax=Aegilops tauschii subsp. strangulata TaxID=200361 RepID=A0A453FRP9_AEGTS
MNASCMPFFHQNYLPREPNGLFFSALSVQRRGLVNQNSKRKSLLNRVSCLSLPYNCTSRLSLASRHCKNPTTPNGDQLQLLGKYKADMDLRAASHPGHHDSSPSPASYRW